MISDILAILYSGKVKGLKVKNICNKGSILLINYQLLSSIIDKKY